MLYPIVAKKLLKRIALPSSVGSFLSLKHELRSGILIEFEALPFNLLRILRVCREFPKQKLVYSDWTFLPFLFPAQAIVFDFSTTQVISCFVSLIHLECASFGLLRKFFKRLLSHSGILDFFLCISLRKKIS